MPKGLVKTKADEEMWNAAKAKAHETYTNLDEENDRFWEVVVTIYKKMKAGGHTPTKDEIEDSLQKMYTRLLILNTVIKLNESND